MDIKENLSRIIASLPQGVKLVAVSKTHPVEMLQEAYDAGQRIFGENKVQEMTAKSQALPSDIEWHFIGHVQRNKIHIMAPYVSVIQGVDTFEKLAEIDRQAARFNRHITCLLQLHIAQEETKFGFSADECTAMLEQGDWRDLKNITIGGVMGMASNTDNEAQVIGEFRRLRDLFDSYKEKYFNDNADFNTISAGMSGDYKLAIEAGSNMVRIGSSIFGERNYQLNK
ncbi:MAG: YggS family pyridoxal phosphate-dependent enzyme [Bacteroidaceae bacterium]|nr:YggS family pyridoxal phosphate-dependent enzyme [Bacteroidaceae bacterium]